MMLSVKQKIDELIYQAKLPFDVVWDGDDSAPTTSFVRLKYRPGDRELFAFNGDIKGVIQEVIELDIFAYGTTVNKSIKVHQMMIDLLECKQLGNIHIGIASSDGLGYNDLGNGIFEGLITFDIVQYK